MKQSNVTAPLTYTVREVAAMSQMGKVTVYKLIEEGTLPGFKIGKSVRIPKEEFDKWYREQANQEEN